jgi:O-antigen/teichoic acid export membrane protein
MSLSGLGRLLRDLKELMQRNGPLALASSMYVGERFIAAVASMVVFVVLARLYGPHDFGIWSYALGVMQFAAAALVGAAEPIIVRELVHRPGRAGAVLGSGLLVLASAAVFALALPLAFIFVKHGDDQSVMDIALLSALAHGITVFAVMEHYFRAVQLPLPITVARLVALITGAFVKVAMAVTGSDIATLGWALVLESVVQMGILWMAYSINPSGRVSWHVSREVVLALVRSCLPAMLAAVAVTALFRVNYLILETLQGFEQVGYYAFAFNITQLVLVIPVMAMAGLYPRLCELVNRDPARFRQVVSWLFFGAAVFGYGFAAVVAVAGENLVSFLFGEKYVPAVSVLIWLFFALAALATATVRAAVINVHQAQVLHLWSALIGLLVLVPLSVLLVPRWGANGAAMAMVVGSLVSGLLTSFLFPQLRLHALDQLKAMLLLTPFFSASRERDQRLPTGRVPFDTADTRP